MFYTSKVLFIHPVRCGGTWLTRWATSNLPSVSTDLHHLKHAARPELIRAVPALARPQAFTVLRPEDERFASYLRLCRGFDLAAPKDWTDEWERVVRSSTSLPEDEFRANHFRPMGEYATADVWILPYEPGLVSCRAWLRRFHGLAPEP